MMSQNNHLIILWKRKELFCIPSNHTRTTVSLNFRFLGNTFWRETPVALSGPQCTPLPAPNKELCFSLWSLDSASDFMTTPTQDSKEAPVTHCWTPYSRRSWQPRWKFGNTTFLVPRLFWLSAPDFLSSFSQPLVLGSRQPRYRNKWAPVLTVPWS